MSQQQPRRPQTEEEPIKYGDVFVVSGEVAVKPVAPEDAATMQAAENLVLGQTQKGGPAAVMQSAATYNERASLVGHNEVTDVTREQGATISETNVAGNRIVTESVGGQVVGQYILPAPVELTSPASALEPDAITIGEALEASEVTSGDKTVAQSDAAAIQAAEVRASGSDVVTPGGVAATAQSAATLNKRIMPEEDKTKLGDVLKDATKKLPRDKAVTREDAHGVMGAELRNNPKMGTHPGGITSSMMTAARINQNK